MKGVKDMALLTGMIEQNVPPQLAAVGERMAKVVGRWWQKAVQISAASSQSLHGIIIIPLVLDPGRLQSQGCHTAVSSGFRGSPSLKWGGVPPGNAQRWLCLAGCLMA